MTLTGRDISELIKDTAEWADKIGETLRKADEIKDKGTGISISMDYHTAKKLEHTLIMCEDVIKNASFNFAPPEEN